LKLSGHGRYVVYILYGFVWNWSLFS
jgi:hypothetical protein